MKNNYLYKLLFTCFIALFFVPKNTYATTKYDIKKSIVKDTTNYDYRLSESEEEEILDKIQKIRRRNTVAIILYATSIFTIGITGGVAVVNSIRTFLELRELEERLKNYPDNDYLAEKLQKVVTTNFVALCIGAIFSALVLTYIAGIGLILSNSSGNLGVIFGSSVVALLYLVFDAAFFKTWRLF